MKNLFNLLDIFVFLVFISIPARSQTYPILNEYKSFGISVQGMSYTKGVFTRTEGNHDIQSNSLYTGAVGFRYSIFPNDQKWGLQTGAFIAMPPTYSYGWVIEPKDKYTTSNSSTVFSETFYNDYSLTIPLEVEYKRQIFTNHYLSTTVGGQCVLSTNGTATTTYSIVDDTSDRQVFGFTAYNREPRPYFMGTIGIGDYYVSKFGLWHFRLTYSKTFATQYYGNYVFGNLRSSPETRGTYKMSGDYVALAVDYRWKKRKK